MDRHVNDEFVKKARIMRYRSRATFKLIEIDDKHNILKAGMKVVDVGAAPGGWSQIIADRVSSMKGQETVVAVDLLKMQPYDGVTVIQGDIGNEKTQELISKSLNFEKADVVCCDAVPDFVGDRFTDHGMSVKLNEAVLESCSMLLREGGTLLMKIIEGPYSKD